MLKIETFERHIFQLQRGVDAVIGIETVDNIGLIPLLHINNDILFPDSAPEIEFHRRGIVGQFVVGCQQFDGINPRIEKVLQKPLCDTGI
jgi:hypothetical protein